MEKQTFTVTNELGEELICEVLFTFDSNETKKSYIAYTDGTLDDNGNLKVYASIFVQNSDNYDLLPIETEKEWDAVAMILKGLQDKQKDASQE